jgi:hypothetical protein
MEDMKNISKGSFLKRVEKGLVNYLLAVRACNLTFIFGSELKVMLYELPPALAGGQGGE